MSTAKITTTPTPLAMVDKINEIITNYLPVDGKAADALKADVAAALSGVTATATELNYVDGVTSNIQTQLNGKLSTSGTAAKATADASGNNIANTYATKATAITGLSASGKTITYTKGNGTTGTITTQDTVYSLPTASSSTLGGIKVGSGLSISSGVLSATGGGIVASSLGTNGYVKFSNGLILQWGYFIPDIISEGPIIFPINYTKEPIVISKPCFIGASNYIEESYGRDAERITTSSFYLALGAGPNYPVGWIAVGKQQWGYSASAGEGSRTMTFPIAFTSYCLNVQGTGSNVSSQATVAWSNLSKTGFELMIGNSGAIYYIAIGYQQWGESSVTSDRDNLIYANLPIAFQNTNYVITTASHCTQRYDNGNLPSSYYQTFTLFSKSITQIGMYAVSPSNSKYFYIAVGVQRNGDIKMAIMGVGIFLLLLGLSFIYKLLVTKILTIQMSQTSSLLSNIQLEVI